MADNKGGHRNALSAFRKRDDGAVSVEFAIWMPLLATVILLIADVTAAFTTQAMMWRSASEVARGIATGRLTAGQAQNATEFTLASAPAFDADGFVTVELTRNYSVIGTGIVLSPLGDMRVEVRHLVETHVLAQN